MKKFENPDFLPMLKQLIMCYQGYEKLANQHFAELGLTSAQFDIIATLGNTEGMTCKDLGEKTFITKGTMTGVLDRLENKGLLARCPVDGDRRLYLIKLTDEGQTLFEDVFPKHLNHMKQYFDHMGSDTLKELEEACKKANQSLSHFLK